MSAETKAIPKHVAIIMDGNGRWAEKRSLPKLMGHKKGVEAAENVMRFAKDAGIKILTLYTFSTENWKRPPAEIEGLMSLLENYLSAKTNDLHKEGIRLNIIGDMEMLPPAVKGKLVRAIELTKSNNDFILNLALNYGARAEIIRAVKNVSNDVSAGKVKLDDITEDVFSKYLYTKGMPDPELLIRTSGEMRISNFLLWQTSYTEFYTTDALWPDFDKSEFDKAVSSYQSRQRRFGGR